MGIERALPRPHKARNDERVELLGALDCLWRSCEGGWADVRIYFASVVVGAKGGVALRAVADKIQCLQQLTSPIKLFQFMLSRNSHLLT